MLDKTKTAKTENPKKTRPKRCKECGEWYTPTDDPKTCSRACQMAYAKRLRDEARAKKLAKLEKEKMKKAEKREKKANDPKKLKKTADDLWSLAIRKKGFCEYCGTSEHLNAHHIFSRINNATRHDLDNGICLCAKHHNFCTTFSAHKTPTEFTLWFIEKFGNERLSRISAKSKTVMKLDSETLKEIIENLKKHQ